jgi:DNA primase
MARPGRDTVGQPVAPLASDDAVEQIKARLNLVEVVQRSVPLRKRGRDWWGLCPFHQEESPSFHVREQQQSWYCFGCQKGGDLFDFVKEIEKVDFRGALEVLADLAGVELRQQSSEDRRRSDLKRRLLDLNELAARYYAHVLWETEAGEPGRELLARRQVDQGTARGFGLGYAPAGSNFAAYLRRRGRSLTDAQSAGLLRRDGADYFQQRLVVPIRDERGRPLAFTGRTVRPDEVRKYVNTPETPAYSKGKVLFALDLARPAIEERGHAVLVEGQFDVIVAHQFGVRNAVASSGTALTPEQVTLLKRFADGLVVVFDNDRAGRSAAERVVKLAVAALVNVRVARIPGEAGDPDEFLRGGGDWDRLLADAVEGRERLMRDDIEGLNLSRAADLETAKRRLQTRLDEVSDPVSWAYYDELARNLLNLDPRLPAFRRSRAGRSGSQPPPPESPGPAPGGNRLSHLVASLLGILAVCPEAAGRVRAVLDPGDLEEDDRTAFLRMVEALGRGGAGELERELHEFPPDEQQLVRRAWAAPLPGVDADLAEDVARRIRAEARARRRRAIINGLAEAERRGDAERVAELMDELRPLSDRE